MAFSKKQKQVFGGMMSAAMLSIAILIYALWDPLIIEKDRLLAASFLPLAFSLFLPIAALARHRFFNAEDIDAAASAHTGSDKARMMAAIIQNTLEQAVLAAFVYYMALQFLAETRHSAILAAAMLFGIGRIFFGFGYAKGAAARAFGFSLTFYPTIILMILMLFP